MYQLSKQNAKEMTVVGGGIKGRSHRRSWPRHDATLPRCRCTQDAIFNLLVILFYIPQSKSSQVYRKTFYRANDFHFGLPKKTSSSQHKPTSCNCVEGGERCGVYDGVSDRQPAAAKDKVFILLAAAFASLSFPRVGRTSR